MARQKGVIKLKGTMGDITFYRTKEGYMAREKGGVSAERVRTDPRFQRTRENMAEFGRAGAAGKLLRASVQSLLRNTSDPKMVSRLTREMVKVIQMDAVNPRGLRNVIDGEAELLNGFDFNINGRLSTTVSIPYTGTIDRATGDVIVDLPAYVPTDDLSAPNGSTHYKLISAAMDINFESGAYASNKNETAVLPLATVPTAAHQLNHTLAAGSVNPLFLVFGVMFFQEINGEYYPLKNGAYNALQIINVSGTP